MPENRLDLFVRNSERVKVRRESSAECVPPSPRREILVLLEQMAVSLVLILREFANAAPLDRWLNDAPRKVVEIQRLSCAALEDRQVRLREFTHSLAVCFERIG